MREPRLSPLTRRRLAAFRANRRGYWLMGTTIFSVLVKLAAAAALIAGLWQSRNLPFVPDIGEVLAQTNADNYTLSMGHILDLSSQSFAALRLPAILAVVVLIVGSLFELRLRIKRMHLAATFALGVTMAGFLVAAHVALIRFDPYLSSHVLVERLRPQLKPEDHLVIYGDQAFGSSLVYYLPHQVELLNGRTTSMWFGSTFPDAPRIFLDNDDFMRLWNSPTRVFLFVPDFEQKKANQLLGSNKMTFASSSGKVIYTNHN